ncbi:abortive infection system antitoxin AbiGi family protein [Photobacterium damselae]|uniref:abortive infection system antitoxin AbiGi family protein n=1 Tax=Photobacterium damselae TaxID=38293 RepID=UPI0030F454B2
MKPKSNNIFHFTKSLDVLKLILQNGVQPRYCLEDARWLGFGDHKYIAFPMSCFCDIPLSRISEHTEFYGEYGIGLTKEWGQKNGLNPVIYSPNDGYTQNALKHLLYTDFHKDIENEVHAHLYKIWSLLKPVSGNMIISNNNVPKEFHQENEWRYVPDSGLNVLFQNEFDKYKDQKNKELERFKLDILPSDIKYIFVPEDSDIPNLVNFINNTLDSYPSNDLKILQSRIISLNTLKEDI